MSSTHSEHQPVSEEDEYSNDFVPDIKDDPEGEMGDLYGDDNGLYHVDSNTYNNNMKNFENLLNRVVGTEAMIAKLQVDDGEDSKEKLVELKKLLPQLQEHLNCQAEYLDALRENRDTNAPDSIPSWSHLFEGLNRHREKNAELSTAAFYLQKKRIIDGLKAIYEPLKTCPCAEEYADQPPEIRIALLNHQKYALKWMEWREGQQICGGILADDMGLGKTLSMIALILTARNRTTSMPNEEKEFAKKKKFKNMFDDSVDDGPEIKRVCLESSTNLRHPQKHKMRILDDSDEETSDCQLPSTSKQGQAKSNVSDITKVKIEDIESEYKPQLALDLQKIKKEDNSDDYYGYKPIKIKFMGDMSMSSDEEMSDDNRAGTLVVCPASVMYQWEAEIKKYTTKGTLHAHVFHGPARETIGLSCLRNTGVVITSYSTVASENTKLGEQSWLFRLDWERIILDEAHVIRNTKTSTFGAICQLRGKYRWALTGTPIQNCGKDAFALMRFLNVPSFSDLQKWNKWLNEGIEGHRRLSFILRPLMLRRTKIDLQERGEMPKLPELHNNIIEVQLSKAEMGVYEVISAMSQKIFTQFLAQREKNNEDLIYSTSKGRPNFMNRFDDPKYIEFHKHFLRAIGCTPGDKVKGIHILVLLLRLRQFCCHPSLVVSILQGRLTSNDLENIRFDANALKGLNIDAFEEMKSCKETKATLPAALPSHLELLKPNNPIFDLDVPSSKMTLIMDKLEEILLNTDDKVIVVSQWTSYLTIIKYHLTLRKHESLEFNGTLDVPTRLSVLDEFNNCSSNYRILLLSLRAGGIGLNLNVANHLLLIDLHWNPQLECQAQDRIYRFGQKKPTFIYRFLCENTVEQRIKALQDHKLEIAKVVLDFDQFRSSGSSLNLMEMKKLFAI